MSVIRQHQTEMDNQKCLADALRKKGYKPTILSAPETIRGHYGERSSEKCDVVLRQEDHNRKADIGFSKGKDGKYKVVTDTWVNKDLSDLDKFTGELKVEYTKARARDMAKKEGLTFLGEKTLPNGKVRLQFSKA